MYCRHGNPVLDVTAMRYFFDFFMQIASRERTMFRSEKSSGSTSDIQSLVFFFFFKCLVEDQPRVRMLPHGGRFRYSNWCRRECIISDSVIPRKITRKRVKVKNEGVEIKFFTPRPLCCATFAERMSLFHHPNGRTRFQYYCHCQQVSKIAGWT